MQGVVWEERAVALQPGEVLGLSGGGTSVSSPAWCVVPGGALGPCKAHLSSLVAGKSCQLCHSSPC